MQAPASDDWYVVEQAGLVRIIRNGVYLSQPFLDIRAGIGGNRGERPTCHRAAIAPLRRAL